MSAPDNPLRINNEEKARRLAVVARLESEEAARRVAILAVTPEQAAERAEQLIPIVGLDAARTAAERLALRRRQVRSQAEPERKAIALWELGAGLPDDRGADYGPTRTPEELEAAICRYVHALEDMDARYAAEGGAS